MYEQKHIDIPRRFASSNQRATDYVAFYGNKVVATDSFRLVEILAAGEPHEPKLFSAQLLKAVKVPKGAYITEKDFGIIEHVDDKFPKYEELQEKFEKQEYIEFSVNGDFLAEIASQFGKLSKHKQVVISIPKKWVDTPAPKTGLPIKLKAPDATAYLMPMNK